MLTNPAATHVINIKILFKLTGSNRLSITEKIENKPTNMSTIPGRYLTNLSFLATKLSTRVTKTATPIMTNATPMYSVLPGKISVILLNNFPICSSQCTNKLLPCISIISCTPFSHNGYWVLYIIFINLFLIYLSSI